MEHLDRPSGEHGSRPLEMDDLALPYFNAVVKESMRLHLITGSTATVRQTEEEYRPGNKAKNARTDLMKTH
eukprot:1161057-Pelagomonas_calceolata.AAC.5